MEERDRLYTVRQQSVIVWKFVGIALVRVEVDHAKFRPDVIWRASVRRFEVRMSAYEEGIRRWVHMRDCKGEQGIPPEVMTRHDEVLEPLAFLTEEGSVQYDLR